VTVVVLGVMMQMAIPLWDRQCRPLCLGRFVGAYYAVDVYLECIVSSVGIFCSSGCWYFVFSSGLLRVDAIYLHC
jgi:hypothetical protein